VPRQFQEPEASRISDLLRGNDTQAAEAALRDETERNPGSGRAWNNLGILVGGLGRWAEAGALLRRAVALCPDDLPLRADLGKALLESGDVSGALTVLRKARRLSPDDLTIRARFAQALAKAGKLKQALAECDACGEYLPALRVRGQALAAAGRQHRALAVWNRLLELTPGTRLDRAIHASYEWKCGNSVKSLEIARGLLDEGPVTPAFASSYVSGRLHVPGETLTSARKAVLEWGRLFPEPKRNRSPIPKRTRPKPRVGYLSQEYVAGPAIHFLLPVFEHRDRERFEVIAYHCGNRRDTWTRRTRRHADGWRNIVPDEQLAEAIRRDEVDILVDLSGHYGTHTQLFQRRLAPVQITVPNCPGSTGALCMDYVLTDRWVCPPGNEIQYTEKAIWLPSGYLAYRPPAAPRLREVPSRKNGYVTFGFFQRPSKLNRAVWDVIAATMRQVPASVLLLQHSAKDLDDPHSGARQMFRAELEARGIASGRVRFQGPLGIEEHLAMLGDVDLAFDSFPYNGQTTTCECLWMGVPVVTMRQELHVARVGWQLMDRIGCPELVTESEDEYVDLAVRLARDEDRRMRYRKLLRPAVRESILLDGSVVRDMENVYEDICK